MSIVQFGLIVARHATSARRHHRLPPATFPAVPPLSLPLPRPQTPHLPTGLHHWAVHAKHVSRPGPGHCDAAAALSPKRLQCDGRGKDFCTPGSRPCSTLAPVPATHCANVLLPPSTVATPAAASRRARAAATSARHRQRATATAQSPQAAGPSPTSSATSLPTTPSSHLPCSSGRARARRGRRAALAVCRAMPACSASKTRTRGARTAWPGTAPTVRQSAIQVGGEDGRRRQRGCVFRTRGLNGASGSLRGVG